MSRTQIYLALHTPTRKENQIRQGAKLDKASLVLEQLSNQVDQDQLKVKMHQEQPVPQMKVQPILGLELCINR